MASVVIKLSALLSLLSVFNTQNSPSKIDAISKSCLSCICQAVSGCKNLKCRHGVCGMYQITFPYWVDAGSPTLPNQSADSPTAHPDCSADQFCAEKTVVQYMKTYAADCNEDGQIDCYDYLAIHKKGGYNCTGDLPQVYVTAYKRCIQSSFTLDSIAADTLPLPLPLPPKVELPPAPTAESGAELLKI